MMSLFSAVVILIVINIVNCQLPLVFRCPYGQDCIVNCTNPSQEGFSCNPTETSAQINGYNATSLKIYCSEESSCSTMRVECPISQSQNNERECTINCDYNNACNDIEIWTHNSLKINLNCGLNVDDSRVGNEVHCSNIIINGQYDVALLPPLEQYININCNDEGLPDEVPVCNNIETKYIGAYTNGNVPNNQVELNIFCGSSYQNPTSYALSCSLFNIAGGKSDIINIIIDSDIINSNLTFNDLGTKNVYIQMMRTGTIINTTITGKNVQDIFQLNTTSDEAIRNSQIYAPTRNNLAKLQIFIFDEESVFDTVYMEGRFDIQGTFRVVDSILTCDYGADFINIADVFQWINSTLNIQNLMNISSIVFNGFASGTINMSRNSSLTSVQNYQYTIICNSLSPSGGCVDLNLDIPSYTIINEQKKHHTFLECLDYGCGNIIMYSLNGGDDISISATHCLCDHGGNSCIGNFNIFCDNNYIKEATFDGINCDGDIECCGPIKQATSSAICSDNNSSSNLSGGEVAGIVIGIMIILLLIIFAVCYCHKQRTLKYQLSAGKNDYTKSITNNTTDNKNNNKTKNNNNKLLSGGYGAVTDDDI